MKNLYALLLVFLLACSQPNYDKNFPLLQTCIADDLSSWTLSTEPMVDKIQYRISDCGRKDELVVDSKTRAEITLVKVVQIPEPLTLTLIANYWSDCDSLIGLTIDKTSMTYPTSSNLKSLRVPLSFPGTTQVSVKISIPDGSCRVQLSATTLVE